MAQVFPAGPQGTGSLGQKRTARAVVPFPPHTTTVGAHGGSTGAVNELGRRGACEGVLQGKPCFVSVNAGTPAGREGLHLRAHFPLGTFVCRVPVGWVLIYNDSVLFRDGTTTSPWGAFNIFWDPCFFVQLDNARLFAEAPLVKRHWFKPHLRGFCNSSEASF